MEFSRRKLIKGSLGFAAIGSLALVKPKDIGAAHTPYFENLSHALKSANYSRPTLVIDLEKLNTNIQTLKQHLSDNYAYRIVVKSLPSIPLLAHISALTNSQRFMVFDEVFLLETLKQFPAGDFLLGKPLSKNSCEKLLSQVSRTKGSTIRWLIDSPQRLEQYRQLALQRQQTLRINIEIDIGLHRGGFSSEELLRDAIQLIHNEPLLSFDGFMGYEPHVIKLPGKADAHLDDSLHIYQRYISLAENILGDSFPQNILLNTAGSTSYQLHTTLSMDKRFCNELSAGSCLVKPLDFDIATLDDHQAASFIATPILKSLDQTKIPGIPYLGDLMAWWNPNQKRSLFTYGGNWKAEPVSPIGLSYNPLYGRSSNQEMLNASLNNPLKMDDWIFLRPTQSEAVFLQFGDIAVFDGKQIIDSWPVFGQSQTT